MRSASGEADSNSDRLKLWVKVVLSLLLVVIGGLRFARMDLVGTDVFAYHEHYTFETDEGRLLENLENDITQYLSMVEDFRGVEGAFYKQEPYPEFADRSDAVQGPVTPFINRVGVPWVASLLPFDSPESFAAVNLGLLLLGLWALFDALRVQGRSPTAQLVGGLLYVVGLPVLVFASALYIDGSVVGILMVGYWFIARRYWAAIVIFLPLSYLVKEVLILLAPVAAVAWRQSGRSFRQWPFVVGAGLAVGGWLAVGRTVQSLVLTPVYEYNVSPKFKALEYNLGNVRSLLFFALGTAPLVIPALLEMSRLWKAGRWRSLLDGPPAPDVVGFLVVVLINVYSIVSTDLTLRTGWLIWPFAISLACRWLDGLERPPMLRRIDDVVGAGQLIGSGSSSR